jgi:hypothetical protein
MMGVLEAVDGMLLFGVSTAYIFAVMQVYWSILTGHVTAAKVDARISRAPFTNLIAPAHDRFWHDRDVYGAPTIASGN